MIDADLYLESIEYERYLTESDCVRCGVGSCRALVAELRAGGGAYSALDAIDRKLSRALEIALGTADSLPTVPSLTTPRPTAPELAEINRPVPGDPVLVTGNSLLTQEILLTVLSTTVSPFFVLFTDTRGDTLDMALIYESFNAERLAENVERERLSDRAAGSSLILAGLARGLRDEVATATGFPVEVGPVCAAELPLYFRDRW
jgi:CO dehydrogenase/acetyl-CoA synthase gamma subunit (corrinoid Fe-S protein)